MKLTIVGGGGFRVPLVYGALLEKADALSARRGRAARHRRRAGSPASARCSTGSRTSTAPAAVPRDHRPRRRRRGRGLRLLRDPRRPARGARGRRERPARASACSGRRPPAPAASASRCARSRRWCELAETIAERAPEAWLINFTNPAGMVTEAVQRVLGDRAVGICDSPSGLCRRVARALGRDAARPGLRLLRPEPPGLAEGRARRRHDRLPELLADDERLAALRGGTAVRRRVAALARDDPERVPLLLLLRRATPSRRSASCPSRAERSCSSSSARSTRATARSHARRSRPGARPGTTASARTWRRRAAPRATTASTRRAERRLRERGDGGARGDGAQHPHRADPQHRQPHAPAVPRPAAPWSRCPRSSAGPGPHPLAVGEVPVPTLGALVELMKDVERTTIEAALTGSRRWRSRRSRCTRWCPRCRWRGRSSTATASGCRRSGGVPLAAVVRVRLALRTSSVVVGARALGGAARVAGSRAGSRTVTNRGSARAGSTQAARVQAARPARLTRPTST